MVVSSLLCVVTLAACAPDPEPPPTADPATRRRVAEGDLIGFSSDAGAHVWRGIPFAAPPVGPLRWRAPQPPAAWEGTREALAYAEPCIQLAGPMGGSEGQAETDIRGSEDCLYLNVHAPRFATDAVPSGGERRPVLFWIHGGGNSVGDAHLYDASTLAVRQDVVVVTVHYRLGVLGWFHHEALHGPGSSSDDRSGNYGTLDTIRALEWVRDNIAAFGGDPGRVTLFGESAGGQNVFALLVSPRAAGLFHGAIAQSGSTQTVSGHEARNAVDEEPPGHPNSSAELLYGLLVADGSARDRADAKQHLAGMRPLEVGAYLRGRSPAELLARFTDEGFGGMYDAPALIRDGRVLPAGAIEKLLAAGRFNAVPAIFGTNRDETKLFMMPSSRHVAHMGPMPLWFRNERMYDLSAEYGAKLWKASGADEPAEAIALSGRSPVWVYRFDWDEEGHFLWADLSRLLGAAHAIELPFVFGTLNLGQASDYVFPDESREAALELAHRMMDYWSALARSGDPNDAPDSAPWPAWRAGAGRFLVLDSAKDRGMWISNETVTEAQVVAAVSSDERFESPQERCEIYGEMAVYARAITRDEYVTVEDGLCKNVPLPE